jgi:hypothetical protein
MGRHKGVRTPCLVREAYFFQEESQKVQLQFKQVNTCHRSVQTRCASHRSDTYRTQEFDKLTEIVLTNLTRK